MTRISTSTLLLDGAGSIDAGTKVRQTLRCHKPSSGRWGAVGAGGGLGIDRRPLRLYAVEGGLMRDLGIARDCCGLGCFALSHEFLLAREGGS